jgi:hypothetical protein
VGREQTEQRGILTAQDDHASLFRALGGICLETGELHPSVQRLLVIAREQHHEVPRVLDGLVHLLDEVRGKGDVVVLDEDLVAFSVRTSVTSRAMVATEPRRLKKKSYRTPGPVGMSGGRRGVPCASFVSR